MRFFFFAILSHDRGCATRRDTTNVVARNRRDKNQLRLSRRTLALIAVKTSPAMRAAPFALSTSFRAIALRRPRFYLEITERKKDWRMDMREGLQGMFSP